MHVKTPWFLCRNTLTGMGMGLFLAAVIVNQFRDASLLTVKIGLIGLGLFLLAKKRWRRRRH